MVNNKIKIGKIFIIFPILFFFLNCQKDNSTSYKKQDFQKKHDSTVTNLWVKFVDTGSLSLNTLVHQRGESYTIYGKKKNDQKTIPIYISKPTVFTSYRLENNKTVSRQYISFGNDTLRFEFNKDTSLFKGNSKNDILNTLFTKHEDFHFLDKQTDVNVYLDDLYTQNQLRLKKLKFYSKDFNDLQLSVIQDYLNLYYYYKAFNIDFSSVNSSDARNRLEIIYDELLQNVELLDKINTILTKQIIYNSLRYIAFKNNKQPYQSIGLINKKLRETEAMSGFIEDLLHYSSNILSEEDKTELKKYLRKETTVIEKSKITRLTASVLAQSMKNTKNEDVKIQQVLSTTTEDFVLIDLWATWCIPCIQENPYWENAKKKYRGKIKFVKISIDTNKDKWEKFLMSHGQINDNFIISNPQHLFIKSFEINSIPRFLLFNKKFAIISDDFTRPSDDSFERDLEKYLN